MALEAFDGDGHGGVAAQILARHSQSQQPESKVLVATVQAILDVIIAKGLQPTPVSLFAATVAGLGPGESQGDGQATAALCTLLTAVLERLPRAFLCSNFSSAVSVIVSSIEKSQNEASVLKQAVTCLGLMLAALDPADWPSAARPFSLMLGFCMDPRPKVRKRAHDGMVQTFAALQQTPAATPASAAVLQVCKRVLPGPEAAVRAASSSSKKSEADAVLQRTVTDALHLLTLMKMLLPLLSASAVATISDLLLKLLHLHQRFLSRAAIAALAAAVGAPDVRWRPCDLADLLSTVMAQESSWDRKDADLLLSVTRLLEDGFARLHELDASLAGSRLAPGVAVLVSLLSAEQEGVRFAAAQALKSLFQSCISASWMSAAVSQQSLPSSKPSAGHSVVASVVSALAARYQESWPHAMSVATALLAALGSAGAPLAAPLLIRLDEIASDTAAAEEEEAQDLADVRRSAEDALGAAVRSLGPEQVLDTLPLRLQEGVNGSGEARTWLLPLIRQHARGASLAYWGANLLPAARACGALAVAADKAGPTRQHQALQCRALELQLWATLPSFASWAADTASAFPDLAPKLGAAFQNRPDLRAAICHALQTLCLQNRAALKAAGETDLIGPGEPPGQAVRVEEGDAATASPAAGAEADIPAAYTADAASGNVAALRQSAMSWLPVLCTAFVTSDPEDRGPLGNAIAAYACICAPDVVAGFFRTAMQKLIKVVNDAAAEETPPDVLTEGGDTPAQRRSTYLDLALCLAGGLQPAGLATLYKTASIGLTDKDSGVQKKSYKVLAYLCESRADFIQENLKEVLEALMAASKGVASAARRFRLRCLKAVILLLVQLDRTADLDLGGDADATAMMSPGEKQQQVVASLVGEIVLACKEVNRKTRDAANEVLVDIGHAMHEAQPPSVTPGEVGGLKTLFLMVIGGMVGETPHMIAASVMALARLLYEFGGALASMVPELMPAVLSLLRSRAREVIKAVLGLLKVVAMRLPVEALLPQLGPILEGVLLWAADSKNKFKLKVRLIVEKLAKRCGFEAMEAAMPPGDAKLLAHIRKERTRKDARKGAAPSEAGEFDMDARTHKTGGGKTARRSAWAASDIFSEDNSDGGGGGGGGDGARTARTGVTGGRKGARSVAGKTQRSGRGGARLPMGAGDEPADLLDAGTSRKLMRSAAKQHRQREDIDDFTRDMGGRLVIKDEEAPPQGKRKRAAADDFVDDDSDDDAAPAGGRGVRFAARSTAAGSAGGRSAWTAKTGKSGKSMGGRSAGSTRHGKGESGTRFKSKKGGGDVKGGSKVEPYAYWPLDRKMLNRRAAKMAEAKAGLQGVIKSGKAGAAAGSRAKRRRTKG